MHVPSPAGTIPAGGVSGAGASKDNKARSKALHMLTCACSMERLYSLQQCLPNVIADRHCDKHSAKQDEPMLQLILIINLSALAGLGSTMGTASAGAVDSTATGYGGSENTQANTDAAERSDKTA